MNRNLVIASVITVAVIIGVVLINRSKKGMASTTKTTKKKKISITPKLSSELAQEEFEQQLEQES